MSLRILQSFDITVDGKIGAPINCLPEIQLWESAKYSYPFSHVLSNNSASLKLISLINTFCTPPELFLALNGAYHVFTGNSISQGFIAYIVKNSTFHNNLGSLSFCVEVSGEDLSCFVLFFFLSKSPELCLKAVQLKLTPTVYATLQKGVDRSTLKLLVASKRPDFIGQVLKSRKESRQLAQTSKAMQSKLKLTIQQTVSSGLRLRGITHSHPDYKELYHHTYRSMEFVLRNLVKDMVLPKLDVLQDLVDGFLSLYLREFEYEHSN